MKLVLATHNAGKVAEFRSALSPVNIEIISGLDLELEEPEETGTTFRDNALIKAKAAAKSSAVTKAGPGALSGVMSGALSDDSGLCVDALNGDPGVYSARWAGADKNFMAAMTKIKDRLFDYKDWTARFVCVICYCDINSQAHFFEGETKGRIIWPPRGKGGFGYDPFFEPEEYPGKTFAELSVQDKQKISHRGRAIRKFIDFFNDQRI